MSCLALAGIGLGVAGGLMSFGAQRKQGREARELAEAQATAKERRAGIMEEKALVSMADMDVQKRADIGASRAAAAASGVRAGTGSPLKVEKKIATEWERNKLRYGRDVADEIQALRTEAKWTRKTGRSIESAGKTRATASLLSTGYQTAMAMDEYDWRRRLGLG